MTNWEQMSMIAFVGYVNTWAVGQGILQEMAREMNKGMVEKIAGQTETVMAQHARDNLDLQTMDEVLKTMREYTKA